MRALFIAGHTLVGKGEAHDYDRATGKVFSLRTQNGEGRALCSCGVFSPVLPGRDKRVKWMREIHKPEVIEARERRSG